MNIQSGQTYIAVGCGTSPTYFTHQVEIVYTIDTWLMVDFIETPLSGGKVGRYTHTLGNFICSITEPLTPETLIKYNTLQDMCWSGLTHNMALDLWNKGYRKDHGTINNM